MLKRMLICEKTNIEWETSDFKHHNLTMLIIHGFQPENKFMGYIRRVMKAAVNLKDISLHDDRCEHCESHYPATRYPHTKQERDLVKKAINAGRAFPIENIQFFHTSEDGTGERFLAFFRACPNAFGSLKYLHLRSVRLGSSDIPNVLKTCKKLEWFSSCRIVTDSGVHSVLRIEHPEIIELKIALCAFQKVELNWLPRLKSLTCQAWMPYSYPLSFGFVLQLCSLNLIKTGTWTQPKQCDLSWTMFLLQAAPFVK
uniref:FBD domain-containing protein n=1 Tax=Leersia perrieri TaxID=77586 RepID=A0A0D9W6D5_9ORYZ